METISNQEASLQSGNPRSLTARAIAVVLGAPLACMELFPHWLPAWLSDYSYGLMFRLGVTFGLVLLLWHLGSIQGLVKVRSILFMLASIASALLANGVGRLVGSEHDLDVIVFSGAIFLALSQKFLLRAPWLAAVVALLAAPAGFYAVLIPFNKMFSDTTPIGHLIANYWPLFWQAGYFAGMFGVSALLKKRA